MSQSQPQKLIFDGVKYKGLKSLALQKTNLTPSAFQSRVYRYIEKGKTKQQAIDIIINGEKNQQTHNTCISCLQTKTIACFNYHATAKNHLTRKCKECTERINSEQATHVISKSKRKKTSSNKTELPWTKILGSNPLGSIQIALA